MIQALEASQIVVLLIMMPLLAAMIVWIWGKKIARQGDWLIGIGLLCSLIGLAIAGVDLYRHDFKPELLQTGWIWSRTQAGSITVGLLLDFGGLLFASFSVLMGLVFLSQRTLLKKEPKLDRVYAALGFSVSGLLLAWFALTPWVALMGLILTAFGGFTALGARWGTSSDAHLATRFVTEKMAGILLAVLGACGMSASRQSLNWLVDVVDAAGQNGVAFNDFLGAVFLVAGLYIQSQPFPLLGSLAQASGTLISIRTILVQMSPAIASFACFFRLETQLKAIGFFPGIGWIYLVSAFLALGMALAQPRWQASFGAWLSAGMSICIAALAFAGPWSGLSLLLGVFVGTVAFASSATAMNEDIPSSPTSIVRSRWMKVVGFLGMGSATGMIGFISVSGMIRWFSLSWTMPLVACFVLFVLFLFWFTGWKLMWKLNLSVRPIEMSWFAIFCTFFFILIALAIFWVGSVTGGAFPSDFDQVLPSLFQNLLAGDQGKISQQEVSTLISSVFLGMFILALGGSFAVARKEKAQTKTRTLSPFVRTVASGYGVDVLFRFLFNAVVSVGRGIENLVDQKIWSEWIPDVMAQAIRRISLLVSNTDAKVYQRFFIVLKNGVEAPAKALQLLQNGDVQWYLLFAIGSSIAILIHFMKF